MPEYISQPPSLGAVIQHSGGLRKVRWGLSGKGKRGGVRLIYYWSPSRQQLLMLYIYAKSERDDLSPAQLKILRTIVEDAYR